MNSFSIVFLALLWWICTTIVIIFILHVKFTGFPLELTCANRWSRTCEKCGVVGVKTHESRNVWEKKASARLSLEKCLGETCSKNCRKKAFWVTIESLGGIKKSTQTFIDSLEKCLGEHTMSGRNLKPMFLPDISWLAWVLRSTQPPGLQNHHVMTSESWRHHNDYGTNSQESVAKNGNREQFVPESSNFPKIERQ